MNLIDGEIVTRDGKAFFKAGENLTIQIRDDLVDSMKRVTRQEEGRTMSRLGIRCEHVHLGRQRISDRSFQLPVYAIAHEAESSVVSFELKDTFFHVRTRGEKGLCDYCLSEMVWLDFDQNHMLFYNKTVELAKV